MIKSREFILIATYPGGEEHCFSLRPGWNSLGSAQQADIRLYGETIQPEHAALWLSAEGVRIKNLGSPGSFELYGSPIHDEIPLDTDEPIIFGDIILSLRLTTRNAWLAPLARAPRLSSSLEKLLGTGLGGYRELLLFLAPTISPDEAESAHQRLQESRHALGVISLIALMVALVPAATGSRLIANFGCYLELNLLPALICLLVMRFRVTFAGRILMIGSIPLLCTYLPVPGWDGINFDKSAAIFVFLVFLAALAGSLFDFAASIEPGRRWPGIRRILLSLIAAVIILGGIRGPILPRVFGIFTGLLIIALTWFFAPRLEPILPLRYPDSELLFRAARRRWGFVLTGRVIAIALACLPIFIFLNTLGLEKRFDESKAPLDVLRSTKKTDEYRWFWTLKSRFLSESDLTSMGSIQFYGFTLSEGSTRDQIWSTYDELFLHPDDSETYERLRGLLAPYHIDSEVKFASILGNDWSWETLRRKKSTGLFLLEKRSVQAFGPFQRGRDIHVAQDLWSGNLLGGEALVPLSRHDIKKIVRDVDVLLWLSLVFALLGFLLIWRRGGDSPLARWLGIWHIGIAVVILQPFLRFSLPAHIFELWHWAADAPLGNFFMFVLVSSVGLVYILSIFQLLFLPLAAVWVHLYWHPYSTSTVKSRLHLGGKIMLVTVAVSLIFYGAVGLFGGLDDVGVSIWAKASLTLIGCLILACAWLKRRSPSANRSARLGYLTFSVFVATQTLTTLMFEFWVDGREGAQLVRWFCGVCLCSIALLVWSILRHDFLHIAAVRDLSAIGTFVFLPILFEWSEDIPQSGLDFLLESSFVSEDGAKLLGLIAAVALLPPIHRIFRSLLIRASIPDLPQFESRLKVAVSDLSGALREERRFEITDSFFKDRGIKSYNLFSHLGDGIFYSSSRSDAQSTSEFRLTASLCEFLTRRREAVDFDRVALEWRYFFHQFELRRLGDRSGCRYLVPILLGRDLWGVLMLPSGAAESWLTRHVVVEYMCSFMIAAMQRCPAMLHTFSPVVESHGSHELPAGTDESLAPTHEPPVPTDGPAVAANELPVGTDENLVPAHESPVPTDEPAVAADELPVGTDENLFPTHEPPVPTDEPAVAADEFPVGTDENLVPTHEPPVPTDEPAAATDELPGGTDEPPVPIHPMKFWPIDEDH